MYRPFLTKCRHFRISHTRGVMCVLVLRLLLATFLLLTNPMR